MNSQRLKFSVTLRRLVDAVERLSEDDLSKLGDESYSIEIRLTRKRNKEEVVSPSHEIDMAKLIEKLTEFANRQEAQYFLDANFSTRKSLELVARKLDIPISKQDKVEALRDKVIEATVGARVRSQAIQGGRG